jgi:hypothetical protein
VESRAMLTNMLNNAGKPLAPSVPLFRQDLLCPDEVLACSTAANLTLSHQPTAEHGTVQ